MVSCSLSPIFFALLSFIDAELLVKRPYVRSFKSYKLLYWPFPLRIRLHWPWISIYCAVSNLHEKNIPTVRVWQEISDNETTYVN
ncbi:MAG: hypothetical protein NXY57DRAFT_999741 [Lentinula lateritia]|nr:MAG: hypothetical protein NXY57DRAFT_999741 [Lentinula lateritia]